MSFLLTGIFKITSPIITSIFTMIDYLFQYFVAFTIHFIENPLHLLITIFVIFVIFYSSLPFNKTVDFTEVYYPKKKWRENGQNMSYQKNMESKDLSELPPLYPNGWIPLMESRDLAIGQSVPITALGHQFVIFRGKTGKSFILDAYCPHLGANLGICGKVHDDCIQCPFHGWIFSGHDGSCVKIPYTDKVPEFAKTKTWLSIEQNGFIYVWYHADGQQPSWMPPVIPEIERGLWIYNGRVQFTTNCHIQDICENSSDVAHFNSLHQASILGFDDFHPDKRWNILKNEWTGFISTVDPLPNQHIITIKFKQKLSIFGILVPWYQNTAEIKLIGPAIFHIYADSIFGKLIVIVCITPEGPLRNKMVQQFYIPHRIFSIFGRIIAISQQYLTKQDILIWNNKKYMKNPLLVSEDKFIGIFRRWYSQFYGKNSLQLNRQTLNW